MLEALWQTMSRTRCALSRAWRREGRREGAHERSWLIVGALLLGLFGGSAIGAGLTAIAYAHEDRASFSAGAPGDPKKLARTIRVRMLDDGNEQNMRFEPALIRVHRGEQIRFLLENGGTESHEFMLATVARIANTPN